MVTKRLEIDTKLLKGNSFWKYYNLNKPRYGSISDYIIKTDNRKDLIKLINLFSYKVAHCKRMNDSNVVIVLLSDGSLMYKACGKYFTLNKFLIIEDPIIEDPKFEFIFSHKFFNRTGAIMPRDFPLGTIRNVMKFIYLKETIGKKNSQLINYGGHNDMIDIIEQKSKKFMPQNLITEQLIKETEETYEKMLYLKNFIEKQ